MSNYIFFTPHLQKSLITKIIRMDIVYYIFFWVLVVEILFYLLLVVPSPRGFKGALTRIVTTSPKFFYVVQGLVVLCAIAGLFFYDCLKTQNLYHAQKDQLINVGHMSSEMRRGWLSYTILKIQRNKYITFMLIYTSAALYLYIRLLNYLYKKRQNFQKSQQGKSELGSQKSDRTEFISDTKSKQQIADQERAKKRNKYE